MIRQEVGNRQGGLTIIVSGSGVADNASRMGDLLGLTDEQGQMRDLVRAIARERIAPLAARLAAGETTAAFSLSEPGAGSDAASLTTTAERRGDRYLLNGTKMWVTNGSHASVITLFATVDRG